MDFKSHHGPCDFGVSPSPFDLDFGSLDFGLGHDNSRWTSRGTTGWTLGCTSGSTSWIGVESFQMDSGTQEEVIWVRNVQGRFQLKFIGTLQGRIHTS